MQSIYERREGIYEDRPKVVFEAQINRKSYLRKLRRSVYMLLAGLAIWVMLSIAPIQQQVNTIPYVLDVGRLLAVLAIAYGAIRSVLFFVLVIRRQPQRVRFYNKGLAWIYGDSPPLKYGWNALKSFRENGRWIRIGNRVLWQWGDYKMTMRDGTVFRFTRAHGNMYDFIEAVRPHIAAETGARIGQTLRQERRVKLHPQLVVASQGVIVGKNQAIPWSKLGVDVEKNKLVIRQRGLDGYEVVRTYPVSQVDNVGGFVELAQATIENYRERQAL